MPIDKKKYPPNWTTIVTLVRIRSGGRCECTGQCGLHKDHPGPRRCTEMDGKPAKYAKGKVMLTTAHLCHDESCADMTHLRHMCQRCHLRYDMKLHQQHARETRRRKLKNHELFEEKP